MVASMGPCSTPGSVNETVSSVAEWFRADFGTNLRFRDESK